MAFFARRQPVCPIRGIHFDLKGTPPTPARHLELLELMALSRLNCALVEWEDTYPWSSYPELRNETAYSRAHVRQFLARAGELGIRVIPLVQCLGHMENVLMQRRFCHLREVPPSPSHICPLKPESRRIVLRMIDEVLQTHAGITHFHLGGDEAAMGKCPACRRFVAKHGIEALYLHQVEPLLDHLIARGIRPILWDDMMRHWQAGALKRLAAKADLMAWSYAADPFAGLPRTTLDRFQAAGVRVWGASAFKGGDGPLVDLPDVAARAGNMLAWAKEATRRPIQGLIATGWSRYSVCYIPCDTIEAGLDCMVLAGAAAWDGKLPPDYARRARAFLHRGRAGALAGKRFDRCLEATRALSAWRQKTTQTLNDIDQFAQLTGEWGRSYAPFHKRPYLWLNQLLGDGRALARKYVAAHAGLIPAVWLKHYADSRMIPIRRRIQAVQAVGSHSMPARNPPKRGRSPHDAG